MELTLEQAVDALAARATAVRLGAMPEKRADALTAIGAAIRDNPALSHTLIGGGLGAAAGGLGTAWGNRAKDPAERKSLLSALLTGGLAGAALGGGVGLARQGLAGFRGDRPPAAPTGVFTDPETGKTFKIDPEVFRRHPGIAAKVRELAAGPDAVDKAFMAGLGGVWDVAGRAINPFRTGIKADSGPDATWIGRNLPFSAAWLPRLGLVDAALHAPGLNLGERIGVGRIRPQFSRDPLHLLEGLSKLPEGSPVRAALEANVPHGPDARTMRVGKRVPGDHVLDILGKSSLQRPRLLDRLRGRGGGDVVMRVPAPSAPIEPATVNTVERSYAVPEGHPDAGVPLARSEELRRTSFKVDPGSLTPEQLGNLQPAPPPDPGPPHDLTRRQVHAAKQTGYLALEKAHSYDKSPRALIRYGPKQFQTAPRSLRIAGRAIGYPLIPALEYAARTSLQERGQQRTLREIMQQLATEQGR